MGWDTFVQISRGIYANLRIFKMKKVLQVAYQVANWFNGWNWFSWGVRCKTCFWEGGTKYSLSLLAFVAFITILSSGMVVAFIINWQK